MSEISIIDMRVRAMGETVNHAIMVHGDELKERAQAAAREAIQSFDWRGTIGQQVAASIERQIKVEIDNFLFSGEGRELVSAMVKRALAAAFG